MSDLRLQVAHVLQLALLILILVALLQRARLCCLLALEAQTVVLLLAVQALELLGVVEGGGVGADVEELLGGRVDVRSRVALRRGQIWGVCSCQDGRAFGTRDAPLWSHLV